MTANWSITGLNGSQQVITIFFDVNNYDTGTYQLESTTHRVYTEYMVYNKNGHYTIDEDVRVLNIRIVR